MDIWRQQSAFTRSRTVIPRVARFDGDLNLNILEVAAHDKSIEGILDFPPGISNDWKARDLKEKGH